MVLHMEGVWVISETLWSSVTLAINLLSAFLSHSWFELQSKNRVAADQLCTTATLAAISAGGMESFEPPSEVKRLCIFGDNDRNFAGQKAAYVLAHRLVRDLEIEVSIPPEPGADWLDVLNDGNGL